MTALLWIARAALAQDDNPWTTVLEGDGVAPPAAEVRPTAPPPAPAAAPSPAGGPSEGLTIEPLGHGGGLRVSQAAVVGGDGGTVAWTARTRGTWDRMSLAVSVPFATFRTADGRDTRLGNLEATFLVADDADDPRFAWGVSAQLPLGRAWTWVHQADELWPSGGVDGVLSWRRPGTTTLLGRVSAGLHGSPGVEPVPPVWLAVSVSGAVDQALSDRFGLVAEGSLGWWDVSPLEVGGLVRADPAEGIRLRGGVVFPLASWAGLQPAPVPAGIREMTLLVDGTFAW